VLLFRLEFDSGNKYAIYKTCRKQLLLVRGPLHGVGTCSLMHSKHLLIVGLIEWPRDVADGLNNCHVTPMLLLLQLASRARTRAGLARHDCVCMWIDTLQI
jgi:hypothetical protein